MQPGREQVLARERRWALPVALATFASVVLLILSTIIVRAVTGDGQAEVLRSVDENGSSVISSAVLQGISFLLLVAPLTYLFRAAEARSDRVRRQLIGLVVAAPIFLAASSVLTATTTKEAASDFLSGGATADLSAADAREECESERTDDSSAFRDDFGSTSGAGLRRCTREAVDDDAAEQALTDSSGRPLALGLGLGGRIGLAFALLYGCLWAMRTGLLSRFWGSLGMAMGVAALLLLIQFTFLWFLYFGLLVAGWVPGGRPPAWAAGEAVPWPTPGERAAAELEAEEAEETGGGAAGEPDDEREDESGPPRKRKQRT